MDTGATSHLHSNVGIISTIYDINMFPNSLVVGDDSSIPVNKVRHTTVLHTNSYRTLTLKNVLITPQIIKKFICIRRFTCENLVSIEFDSFGFSVKELKTKQILMRCDSTGDLYPLTTPHHSSICFHYSPSLASTSWLT